MAVVFRSRLQGASGRSFPSASVGKQRSSMSSVGVEDGDVPVAVAPDVSVPVASDSSCRGSTIKAEAPRKGARRIACRKIEECIVSRDQVKAKYQNMKEGEMVQCSSRDSYKECIRGLCKEENMC